MTEGVVIALITAFGSLLGGIIGAFINGYFNVKVVTIKQTPSQLEASNDSKKSIKRWGFLGGAIIGAILIFGFLKITGYISPISFGKKFVTKLIVPSNNNLGITYSIPESGLYTFQYSGSAVEGWQADNEARWHTRVNCFRGDRVEWTGIAVASNHALIELGSFKLYKTKDEVIKASIGEKAAAYLMIDEQITCVITDGYNDFYDNSGEVILDVFISPQ